MEIFKSDYIKILSSNTHTRASLQIKMLGINENKNEKN
jgi:hypothetical protein